MATTASALISKAASQIGYNKPVNSSTKYGVWYGIATGQWCAMFVSWVASEVDALDIIPKHAYTPNGVAWFKKQGQWTNGIAGVKRGDIVYFDFPGLPNRVSHVGIVESVNSDGSVNTIEGNTSGTVDGDQRNGGLCARKRRKSYIVGYGRPKYLAEKPTVAKPAVTKVDEDMYFGPETIGGLQTAFGTPRDKKISYPSLLTLAVQKMLRKKGYKGYNGKALKLDGYGLLVGTKTNTIWAFQSYLIDLKLLKAKYRDGIISKGKSFTALAIQQGINQKKINK